MDVLLMENSSLKIWYLMQQYKNKEGTNVRVMNRTQNGNKKGTNVRTINRTQNENKMGTNVCVINRTQNENKKETNVRVINRTRNKNKRATNVSVINRTRNVNGEFHYLYPQLRQDPEKFLSYFQMKISTFDYILTKVEHRLMKQWTNFIRNPINPDERLVVTLRYLVTGTSFASLALTFRMGERTVSSIVRETVDILWEELQSVHMKEPTENDFEDIAKQFYEKWNFPLCIGAIGGKHVQIKSPKQSGNMYDNYEKKCSILLRGVADSNCKFITIDVGGYGKPSDGGTFRASSLFQKIESKNLNIPPDTFLPSTTVRAPFIFIGDEAYPLLNNLLKPFNRRNLDSEKEYFNMHLAKTRQVIECAFGTISDKFQILWKPIDTPDFAEKIIKCICLLHNIIIDKEGIDYDVNHILSTSTSVHNIEGSRENNRPTNNAKFVRERFKRFICSNKI